jgi:large subunit ribosomal protein L25
MSLKYELSAEVRDAAGRGASRRLRYDNKVPAILYGAEKTPEMLSFNHYHVLKALENEGFYSHILTLHINNEKQQAVLKDVQRHPFKPRILHLDFLRINPKEKIVMNVPLHFTGEDKSAALKEGGVFMHLTSSVEVRCLPSALPEYIEVDVSALALDQTLHLSELKLPEGVELTAFAHGHAEAHDTGVVKMHIPRAVEEEPAAVPAGEVPASSAPAAGKEAGKEKTDSKK